MSNKPQTKVSIGNYLNFPNTQKFLTENLQDNKSEFVSNLIALSENDKNIAECDPKKLMMCAMNATALNLPLNKNLGYAYVIAYKGVPQFQIGYKGLIQLAIRTGAYEYLNAVEIREGEIKRNKFTGEVTILGEFPDNKIIGYLACLKLNSGFRASVYMTESQIEAHALRFSKSYQYDKKSNGSSSKWSDSEARPKMANKTVLKALLGTYGVMSTELGKALANDSDNEDNNSNFTDAEIIPQEEPNKTVKI